MGNLNIHNIHRQLSCFEQVVLRADSYIVYLSRWLPGTILVWISQNIYNLKHLTYDEEISLCSFQFTLYLSFSSRDRAQEEHASLLRGGEGGGAPAHAYLPHQVHRGRLPHRGRGQRQKGGDIIKTHDMMTPWHDDTMTWWHHKTMTWWHHDMMTW